MSSPTQTLRVRITGAVGDLLRATAEARAAIRGIGSESDRNNKPIRALTDGLARFGAVARGLRAIALPAAILLATPQVLGLAAALAQASGAGLILPGALAGVATVVGALKIATSGFGEALKNIGDPAKFAAAIATLTPSARAAAIAVQGLKAPFDNLRNSLQERLFANLAPEITATGNALLGVLRPAFESVASTANRTLSGVLVDLRSVRSQADLRSVTGNSATAFSNLTNAVRPLLRVLTDVAAVGAGFLPSLTAGAGAAAQRFADMVSRMRQTGELAAIIQRGLDVLKQLGQIAANVGSILAGVFRAADAAGGGLLNTLASTTGTLKEIINSASGQTALGAFFGTLATITATLGGALRTLAPVLAAVLTNLQTAITQVAPSIGPLVAAIGGILGALAPLLPLIGQVAAIIAGELTTGLTTIKPLIDAAVAVLQLLSPVLEPIVASLIAMKLAKMALTIVMGAGSTVIGTVTTAWKLLSLVFAASPIGFVITLIAALVAGLIYAYQNSETFRNIVNGAFKAVVDFISGAISFISGLLSGLVTFFSNVGTAAYTGIVGGLESAVSFVTGIPGRILHAMGDTNRLLLDAGLAIIRGLGDGIRNGIDYVLGIAGDALSAIRDLFPFSPAKRGPFSGRGYTTYSGTAMIADMAQSIRAAQPILSAAAAAAMSGAQQSLSGPTSLTGIGSSGGGQTFDPAELAAAIGAELRAVFADGVRTDIDYRGLTLRVNAVNRSNARR